MGIRCYKCEPQASPLALVAGHVAPSTWFRKVMFTHRVRERKSHPGPHVWWFLAIGNLRSPQGPHCQLLPFTQCLCVVPWCLSCTHSPCGHRWWSGALVLLRSSSVPFTMLREVETSFWPPEVPLPPAPQLSGSVFSGLFLAVHTVRGLDHNCLPCPFPALTGLPEPTHFCLSAHPAPGCQVLCQMTHLPHPRLWAPPCGHCDPGTVSLGRAFRLFSTQLAASPECLGWGSQLPAIQLHQAGWPEY